MTPNSLPGNAAPRIQSLARADAILTAVMRNEGHVSLRGLTDMVGLNKTTVFNLAESLVALGFLSRTIDPKGYRLGLRCLELGRHVSNNLPVLELCRPVLRELCHETGETVNLAVPYLEEAILVEALQSRQGVRATAYAGARSSYHSSACGKAILAFLPVERRRWLYDNVGLHPHTEFTITSRDELEAQLEDIRAGGVATEVQENELGASCVAVPIFGPSREIVAAISVTGVLHRMTDERVASMAEMLRKRAEAVTRQLKAV